MLIENNLDTIYLDACATSPIHKDVLARIVEVENNNWGNPASLHQLGIQACEVIERSRYEIAETLNCDLEDIIFTSGSTESINLALLELSNILPKGRIVISEVEHPAVRRITMVLAERGWEVEFWPVDKDGVIKLNELERLLEYPTRIVSIIWAQSEIGTIQPVELVAKECRSRNIFFHTDATQIINHRKIDWRNLKADLLSISSHKFRGPKGIGLLLKDSRQMKKYVEICQLDKKLDLLRYGTPSVSLVAGMSLAMKLLDKSEIYFEGNYITAREHTSILTKKLKNNLSSNEFLRLTGHPEKRISNHLSFLVSSTNNNPLPAREVVRLLSKSGLCVSSGTACSSGELKDSYVLRALGIQEEWQQSGIRLSLGSWLTVEDISKVSPIILDVILSLS